MDKYFIIAEYEDYGGLFSSNSITEIIEVDTEEECIDEVKKIKEFGNKLIKIIKGKEVRVDE